MSKSEIKRLAVQHAPRSGTKQLDYGFKFIWVAMEDGEISGHVETHEGTVVPRSHGWWRTTDLEQAAQYASVRFVKPPINDLDNVPAAACWRCGGWTAYGGCSQHSNSYERVDGRTGCTCNGNKLSGTAPASPLVK